MKFNLNKKQISWGVTAFLVIAAAIAFLYLLFFGSSVRTGAAKIVAICMPVIDGLIVAFLLTPLVNWLEQKIFIPLLNHFKVNITASLKRKMRGCAIILTMIFVFFIIRELFGLLIPELVNSIKNIIYHFPYYMDNLADWITEVANEYPDVEKAITEMLIQYSDDIENFLNTNVLERVNDLTRFGDTLRQISVGFMGVFVALWNLILGFIISVYVLASKETFCAQAKKVVFSFFKKERANGIINFFRLLNETFSGFLGGKIVDSIIIGILCFIGTSLMGTPYAVLISVIVGVTNIIPFFGPYFGAIPSSILILMVSPLKCLYFIIFILFLQQLDGNVIGPKILGNSTGLSSFWVIFAITIFGGAFGVVGMIVGVPIFAVFYTLIKEKIAKNLVDKGLPEDTGKYMKLDRVDEDGNLVDIAEGNKAKSGYTKKKAARKEGRDKTETEKPENDSDSDTI